MTQGKPLAEAIEEPSSPEVVARDLAPRMADALREAAELIRTDVRPCNCGLCWDCGASAWLRKHGFDAAHTPGTRQRSESDG